MRNKSRHLLYIIALAAISVLASCASHKQNAGVLAQQNIVAQGSLTLKTDGKEMSAPAKLSLSRDRIIRLQVLMPFLGSEVVRAEFSPTEILVVDRMNKRYVKESYATVDQLVGANLSYPFVQRLVLDYLAVQDELRLEIPGQEKPVLVSLKGNFDNVKATDEVFQPTEISSKFKKMQVSDLGKLLDQQ